MKARHRFERDDWTSDGSKINTPEKLATIRRELEEVGPILVQHWYYKCARSPHYLLFWDFDKFMEYLETEAYAGDAIDIWSVVNSCKPENELVEGKCPDDDGLVPRGGVY